MDMDLPLGVTGNARLLTGYIAGSIMNKDDYSVVKFHAETAELILKHNVTKNTYRVSVEQLTGTE
jgi:hypothetical protein